MDGEDVSNIRFRCLIVDLVWIRTSKFLIVYEEANKSSPWTLCSVGT